MRIDKIFSQLGLLSRSECKAEIKAGHIRVGDRIVKKADEQADPDSEAVFYKGRQISWKRFVYYMLNKPAGVVTARTDVLDQTVFSFIEDTRKALSPVGRLDKDTTGILIITNDGELNHKLLSSKYHVPKEYIVTADGIVSEKDLDILRTGTDIGDDTPTLPALAQILNIDDGISTVSLTIYEGRYHQVKRMFNVIGKPVIKLHRRSFGPLTLDERLKPGEARMLTDEEISILSGN